MDHSLTLLDIDLTLGSTLVLKQITLKIERGEILVLMGLSGSGKSSLLRCINGMNGRDFGSIQGSIHFQPSSPTSPIPRPPAIDITRCPKSELVQIRRHQMAMVFQHHCLLPWKTVLENAAFPLEIQNVPIKERLERAADKLKLVGLEKCIDNYPHELSGGMQQRVGLARAFVTDASVLLMDEPFSALDPLHRKLLQDEILSLQAKLKKTIVFVTHDPTEATRLANRIAVMDSGRILQIDTPEEISLNPSSEKIHQLVNVH